MNSWVAIAISVFLGFAVTFFSGFFVIPGLHKAQSGIIVSPAAAMKKQRYSPTMGGLLIVSGTVAAIAVVLVTDKILGGDIVAADIVDAGTEKTKLFSGILMALSYAFVGFSDDYIRASGKRLYGLSTGQRAVMQIIIILGYLYSLHMTGATYIFIPFAGNVDTGMLFWLIGPAVMLFTEKAVSLSDGKDGLCAGMSAVFAAGGAVLALVRGLYGAGILASAAAGALSGFLVWNMPSRVKAGSTGSMLMGGIVTAIAYCVNMPWIILLAGAGYAAEFVSYALHIAVYKLTGGKKLLKKTPLHSHMEECGCKSAGIVTAFTAMNITGAVIAILLVIAGRPE